MKKNKIENFCYNAFLGLDISPSGDLKPCCKYQNKSIPKFNILQGISTYKDSKFLKDLQTQFLNNSRPAGCIRCWQEEDAGIKSKRQLDYERHETSFKEHDTSTTIFKNISLAFGNLCNLACRICGPASSSKWSTEMKKIDGKDYPIHDWFRDPKAMLDILENTQQAIHFDIPGGEPLLVDIQEHFDLLQKIKKNNSAKNISLHYTTNGTNYPKDQHLKIWQSFKEVDIQISIDDIKERFEYNRWPAKWNTVYENIKKFQRLKDQEKNIKLSISFTVSAFTILYADEFYSWCLAEGLPEPWMGRLHDPIYYRCSVFPTAIKKEIKKKLSMSQHSEVKKLVKYLETDESDHFKDFKKWIDLLDSKRNQNFNSTFPELSKLIL
jgi:MoaA/NifB/PqqE/SkfB family radical SAM enzyme